MHGFCYSSWRSENRVLRYFSLTVDKRVISIDWDILSCVSLRNWYHSIYPLSVLNYTSPTSTFHPSWHTNTNRSFRIKQWMLWLNWTIGFHVCLNFVALFHIIFVFCPPKSNSGGVRITISHMASDVWSHRPLQDGVLLSLLWFFS